MSHRHATAGGANGSLGGLPTAPTGINMAECGARETIFMWQAWLGTETQPSPSWAWLVKQRHNAVGAAWERRGTGLDEFRQQRLVGGQPSFGP
jgi:hypothetical protein